MAEGVGAEGPGPRLMWGRSGEVQGPGAGAGGGGGTAVYSPREGNKREST